MTPIQSRLELVKKTIESMCREGYKPSGIASRYKCGEPDVREALTRWGIAPHEGKPPVDEEAILELHRQGLSAYAITKQLGLAKNKAERVIAKAGGDISHRQKKRDDPLVNHAETIIARYEAGEGIDSIGKDYGCQGNNIMRLLRRRGMKLRTLRDYAHPVNEAFFDTVDTEEKAYVLGFFMADGCNQQNVPCVSIALTDRDILVRMAEVMEWKGPIQEVPPKKAGHRAQYAFRIGSRRMSDALAKVGCVARKSYVATFPDESIVPRHLIRHLVRGWSDGDGTITHKNYKGVVSWHTRIVGTEAVCRGLSAAASIHVGFPGCVCPVHEGDQHTTWGFTVSGHDQLDVYLSWLYVDATIFLPRKQEKYHEFLAHLVAKTGR